MRKSGSSIKKSGGKRSDAHNKREQKISYLMPGKKPNERVEFYTRNEIENFVQIAQQKYKQTVGQKMQKKQIDSMVLEEVITLKDHHKIDDVKRVFQERAKRWGGHQIFNITIHRDEGYWEHKMTGIRLAPGKDIALDDQGTPRAISDTAKELLAISSEFDMIYNTHAHVEYTKFDMQRGKTARMNRQDMREMNVMMAKSLGMKTSEYSNEKSVSIAEFKRIAREATASQIARLKEQAKDHEYLKEQYANTNAELMEKIKSEAELKAELEATKEAYRAEREALKASGMARQEDYSTLKAQHQEELNMLKKQLSEARESKNTPLPIAEPLEEIIEAQRVDINILRSKLHEADEKEIVQERAKDMLRQERYEAIADVKELQKRLEASQARVKELEQELRQYRGGERQQMRKELNKEKKELSAIETQTHSDEHSEQYQQVVQNQKELLRILSMPHVKRGYELNGSLHIWKMHMKLTEVKLEKDPLRLKMQGIPIATALRQNRAYEKDQGQDQEKKFDQSRGYER